MIVKKIQGGARDLSNCRPISLTNTMYKIFASLLQKRLSSHFGDKIRPTQFGFRANGSTSRPIHIMRRMLEHSNDNNITCTFYFLTGSKPSTLLLSKPLRQHLSILAFLLYFRRRYFPFTLTQDFVFAMQDKLFHLHTDKRTPAGVSTISLSL